MKYKFLVENKTDNPGIMAEHGLSVYIEASHKKILFDAGATDLLIRNAEKMEVDLGGVDFAVVSHGHYDHTGGFSAFCQINNNASIYIHKDAFRKSYGMEDGKLEDETSGIRWSRQESERLKDRLVFTDGPCWIDEDTVITGTVICGEDFRPTENFFYRDEEGQLVRDDMCHEQCLVIREKAGLYIFSGCSHRGAVSAINTAKAMFPGERVAVLVAGMHLYSASDEDRQRVIGQILREDINKVMPVHCTGIKAICDLKTGLGEKCVVVTAGDSFDGC
ncbi:MAG: MBL fold metallo-hydrolase [Clostridiales bacterium]|nr:MBL fold metallo-hydrolase [Clostridiales bacterium]